MMTVEDLIHALAKLPPTLPVAVVYQECDGDKFGRPVERVVKRTAEEVFDLYGLEIDAVSVAVVSTIEHD